MLTVIEHNKHVTTIDKIFREHPAYSKAQKKYVLKKVTKRDSVGLKKDILNSVAEYMERNEKPPLYTHSKHVSRIPKPSKKRSTGRAANEDDKAGSKN